MTSPALPLFVAVLAIGAAAQASSQTDSYAIVDVTVIDVENGIAIPGQTVVVVDDHIEWMGPVDDVAMPKGASILDGRGLFLMPGLVDAHVHYFDRETFGRLFVANGVTLVRDTGMANELVLPLRADLESRALLGPELRTAGTMLDGAPPLIPTIALGVATPEDAGAAVHRQAAAGVDFIKVYSRLDADVFLAIVEEAHALGLKVIGHVPDSITIEAAAAAGLDESEHFFGFDKLVGRLLGAPVKSTYAGMGSDVGYFLRLGELDPAVLRAALDGLRTSGLTVCPTVVTFKMGTQTRAFQSGVFPGSEFVSQTVLDTWRTLWAGQNDLPPFVWQTWANLVVELHKAGIPLMVGTDLSVPGILPGFAVHDEMAIWQDAGIPAADVLRSATLVPAEFLGMGDLLGTIAAGKTASMVLLRANPLEDVRNARETEAVFLRGQYFDRAALDRLLEEARELAKR